MRPYIKKNIVHGPEEILIPGHLSYSRYLFDKIKSFGDQLCLICAETNKSWTYKQILQKSVNFAIALKSNGVKKGDVVGLSSENRIEFIFAALGIMYIGAQLTTLNMTYTAEELAHILKISKPKWIVVSPFTAPNIEECIKELPFEVKLILFGEYDVVPATMFDSLIEKDYDVEDFEVADVRGEDVVAVMCSSGTTGLPKGVMLTHLNLLTITCHEKYYIDTSCALRNHQVEMGLAILPWFHALGFLTTFCLMSLGLKGVFMSRFEGELFLESIQKYKVNITIIVPPLAVFMAKHPLVDNYDLTSLKEVWSGAAPLSKDIQIAVSKRMGIDYIKQGYGLTEVTMVCFIDLIDGSKQGSCGIPAPGMKVKVLNLDNNKLCGPNEEGELWIKSSLTMKGYMGDPAATAALFDEEGFIRTGDVGYYDSDGCFFIVDRIKELIKYKGFQVPPAEIEAVVLQLPGVLECGVVGAPDEAAGELPAAFVVRDPAAGVTERQIVDLVASKMSSAKHLRGGVIFVEELPKNPTGKILRRELRKMLPLNQKKSKL